MTVVVLHQFSQQLVAKLLTSGIAGWERSSVDFIHYHAFRTVLEKICPVGIHFNKIDADYCEGVIAKYTLGGRNIPFQLGDCPGANHHRLDVEFVSKFFLPLIA